MVNHVEACFPTPSVDYVPAHVRRGREGIRCGLFQRERARELPQHRRQLRIRRHQRALPHAGRARLGQERQARPRLHRPRGAGARGRQPEAHDGDAGVERRRRAPTSMPRCSARTRRINTWRCRATSLAASSPTRSSRTARLSGVSTSRCYSYYFRQMLSLCVLDVALCEPGTEVTVSGAGPACRKSRSARPSRPRRTRKTTGALT